MLLLLQVLLLLLLLHAPAKWRVHILASCMAATAAPARADAAALRGHLCCKMARRLGAANKPACGLNILDCCCCIRCILLNFSRRSGESIDVVKLNCNRFVHQSFINV
jgi:hypothetical protein